MTMGLACDREGYDLRMPQCPKCGSRGCPKLHRYNGKCEADKPFGLERSGVNQQDSKL